MNLDNFAKEWLGSMSLAESSKLLSEYSGKNITSQKVRSWRLGLADMPLWVCQMAMDRTAEQSEGSPEDIKSNFRWQGERLRICIPTVRGLGAKTAKCIQMLSHIHSGKISLDIEENTLVDLARDRLAHRFLASEAEWLLFVDDDMVLQVGDYQLAKRWGYSGDAAFCRQDTISRLISQGKSIVSGLYYDRHGKGIPIYLEAMSSPTERSWAVKGPHDVCKPTKGTGAGCLLINRSVFEKMKTELYSSIKPHHEGVYRFFEPLAGTGEDFSFCARCTSIGINPYIDLGCPVGHEGTTVHWK